MRRALAVLVAATSVWACVQSGSLIAGGDASTSSDTGGDGSTSSDSGAESSSSSSSGASSSGSSGSSSGVSGGSSGSSSGSGGPVRVPVNHRPDDTQCSTPRLPGSCSGFGGCQNDMQCALDAGNADAADAGHPDAGYVANGRCNNTPTGSCTCTYDLCLHDSDCTGGPCACHGSAYTFPGGNECVPGNCRIDSDCGPGGYCSPSNGAYFCGGPAGYYCHTPSDLCTDDTDCSDAGSPQMGVAGLCEYAMAAQRWECQQVQLCY